MKVAYVYVLATAIVTLLLSFASINVALDTYESWVKYRCPFTERVMGIEPPKVQGDSVAKHVVFILLDGLGVDTLVESTSQEEFRRLVSMGAFYPNGLANTPTYSVPARASILTGAPPEINGVLSNDFKGALSIDNIARASKDEGFKILCVGDKSVEMLLSDVVDEYVEIEEGSGHGAIALAESLKLFKKYSEPGDRVFLWINVADVDIVGHLGGGSGSPEYKATAVNTGRLLLNFLESLAEEDALIILMSDHGFKEFGHHGGAEMEVRRVFTLFIGPKVKSGMYNTSYTHNDLAPTVAMLMGLRVPAQSIGSVIIDGFDVPKEKVEMYSVASKEQASKVVTTIGEFYGTRVLEDPWKSYLAIKDQVYSEGMGSRIVIVSALAIPLVAGIYASLRIHSMVSRRLIPLTVIGVLVYEVTCWVTYSSLAGPMSLSDALSLGDLLEKTKISAVVASITLAISLALVELTPFRVGISKLLVPTVTVLAFATILGLLCATPFYLGYGSMVRFPPPDWNDGFMFFVYLMKASFTGFLGLPISLAIVALFSIVGLRLQKYEGAR